MDLKTPHRRIINIFKRVLDKILSNPSYLLGFYDVSLEEVSFIERYQKIPLEIIQILAEDHYFEREYKKII